MTTPEAHASVTRLELADLVAWQAHTGLLRRPVRSQAALGLGSHQSIFRGQGMEFDEVRLYQAGDDVSRIDWRVTARTQQTHVKLFREERERPVLQCMDYRPAMFFATRGRLKAVQATHLAALLCWAVVKRGDRLGGVVFSAREHHEVRPARGRHGVLRWLQQCVTTSHHVAVRQPAHDATDRLGHMLVRLRYLARPGTTLMLFSDFRGLNEDLLPQFRLLARHCECLLCHVYDPLERQLPETGGLLTASDGQRRVYLDTDNSRLQAQVTAHFSARQAMLETLAEQPRLHLLNAPTDVAVADIVAHARLWA